MADVKDEIYAHDAPKLLDDIIDLGIHLDSRMELRCKFCGSTSWSQTGSSDSPLLSEFLNRLDLLAGGTSISPLENSSLWSSYLFSLLSSHCSLP